MEYLWNKKRESNESLIPNLNKSKKLMLSINWSKEILKESI
jgi:hypothetical protein